MRVVYVDLLFGVNLVMNYLLLLLTARLTGQYSGRWRLFFAASVGALFGVILYFPEMNVLSALACKAVLCVLITGIAFYGKSGRALLKQNLIFLGVSLAFGGGILALSLVPGYRGAVIVQNGVVNFNLPFLRVACMAALIYFLLSLIFSPGGAEDRKKVVKMTLSMDRNVTSFNAFSDTGNLLRDPVSGNRVIFASKEAVLPLFSKDAQDTIRKLNGQNIIDSFNQLYRQIGGKCRLVPYRGAAGENGMIIVFKPESVVIDGKVLTGYMLGISPNPMQTAEGCLAIIGV